MPMTRTPQTKERPVYRVRQQSDPYEHHWEWAICRDDEVIAVMFDAGLASEITDIINGYVRAKAEGR